MYSHLLISGLLGISLLSCQAKNTASNLENEAKMNSETHTEIISLKEGETKFLDKQQVNISFKKVVEDSRCPEGVNCVWEGVATIELVFTGVYTRPMNKQLSTQTNAQRGYTQDTEFVGYKYVLTQVDPKPTAKKSSEENRGNYVIKLAVEKLPQ